MISRKIQVAKQAILYKTFGKRSPIVAQLQLTYRCDSSCRYCCMPKNAPEMGTAEVFDTIDALSKNNCHFVNLTGGEPLLREDIKDIIRQIRSKHMKVIITTNGKNIEAINDMYPSIFSIGISLDGPEEINDRIRGKGAFRNAIKAICLARIYTKVVIMCTITQDNADYLQQVVDISKQYDVPVFFQKISDYNYGSNFAELDISNDKLKAAIENIAKNKKDYKIINTTKQLRLLACPDKRDKIPCYAGDLYLTISPQGEVLPCCILKGKFNPLNIRTDSFKACFDNLQTRDCKECNNRMSSFYNVFMDTGLSFNIANLINLYKILR